MASGIYDYCADHSLTVGEDISLAGFDNKEICLAFRPQLTTIAPPLYEIGQKSAQIIIDEINGNGLDKGKIHIKMPCHIIERGSIKNLRNNRCLQESAKFK